MNDPRDTRSVLQVAVSVLVVVCGSAVAQQTDKEDPRYKGRMKGQTRVEEKNAKGWVPPSGDSPIFTTDWVSEKTDGWTRHLGHLKGQANVRGMEIGSFEGRSAIWFLENILTGEGATMTCLDLFGERLDLFFDHNIRVSGLESRVRKVKGSSQALLREFSAEETFDFIYVDGCHLANCALADMVLSWDLLKRGGIMIVDDYGLAGPPLMRPKLAVDAFIEIYAPNLEIIEKDYQIVLGKTQSGY